MTITFPDLSTYDGGYTIPAGTPVVIARATMATDYADDQYQPFKARAAVIGARFAGYHWLNHGSLAAQAAWAYSRVGTVPLMIDAEDVSGNHGYNGALTVGDITGFTTEYRKFGGIVHLVYLPHWYWADHMGSPNLTPLADTGLSLVSSNYTTYSDTGPGWNPYGGMTPVQWQFTSTPHDTNAFKGTADEWWSIASGGDDMATIDQEDWDALTWRVEALAEGRKTVAAGPRVGEPMRLIQTTGGTLDATQRIEVALAASATRETATLAAINALAAGGTSVDTASVINAINAAAAAESQAVLVLQAQVTDLRAKLAAAAQATADTLTP